MADKPNTAEPVKRARSRWLHLSPDRFVILLLLVICLLWVSERFQWFGFNHHNGWTVLIAVAAVGVPVLLMPLWWAACLIAARRFQFGIRPLLAFCLACSIAVSWLTVQMRQARRQAEVLQAIRSSGGTVGSDWEFDSDSNLLPLAPNPGPRVPVWLRNLFSENFFSTPVLVNFAERQITDADLNRLTELRQLERLNLSDTKISDAGLENIAGLSRLQYLDLTRTMITDVGLENLRGLSRLQCMLLNGTQITDAGLESLVGLSQLQYLSVQRTGVTGAGVKKFQQALPNCKIYH